jgi:hypothetical protein
MTILLFLILYPCHTNDVIKYPTSTVVIEDELNDARMTHFVSHCTDFFDLV